MAEAPEVETEKLREALAEDRERDAGQRLLKADRADDRAAGGGWGPGGAAGGV